MDAFAFVSGMPTYLTSQGKFVKKKHRDPGLKASSLWARPSCFVEELGPVGRDSPLGFAQVHSALNLHSQKILDRILLLEEPLGERNSRRPA
jgi:hypothetical protein